MARTIAVSGTASGLGLAVRQRLEAAGDRVVGVDLRDAEVIADLERAALNQHGRHGASASFDLGFNDRPLGRPAPAAGQVLFPLILQGLP